MLLGLETRITDSLAMVEERQAAEALEPAVEPNWVDKESWEAANQEIQSDLSRVTAMLLGLETRITDSLAMVEERQAAEALEPEDALTQEELQAIKEMLMEIIAKTDKAEALNSEPESEPMASVQVMAPVAQVVEHECGIVEVRLLRGDSVWNIVARFKSPPSPALVNEVVEYNDIKDPRRLRWAFLSGYPWSWSTATQGSREDWVLGEGQRLCKADIPSPLCMAFLFCGSIETSTGASMSLVGMSKKCSLSEWNTASICFTINSVTTATMNYHSNTMFRRRWLNR
jgi:hypothetical protein